MVLPNRFRLPAQTDMHPLTPGSGKIHEGELKRWCQYNLHDETEGGVE